LDFYSLFEQDDPKEQAAMLGAALRGQQGVGSVLATHPLLAQLGQQMQARGDKGQAMLAEAGQQKYGSRLQQLMQDRQQKFTSGENFKNRAADMERLTMELGLKDLLARQKAESDKAADAQKAAGDLRKELQGRPEFKAYQEVATAFDKVQRAAKGGNAASDMSLVFGYMKLLDPGSTVREGEYANAQNATGVPGQLINLYNKSIDGQLLNPAQRASFVKEAGNLFGVHRNRFDSLSKQYSGLAQKLGADPADVVLGSGEPGSVDDGGGGFTPQDAARLQELMRKKAGR
jgi:hypothetical protein